MFEWLDPYKKQFRELWEKLDTRARIIIGAVLVAIVFFMIFMVFMTGGTQYTTLFSNLTARDANSIVQHLEESNISYQLEDNGRTIQVGSDVVHNVRLEMAGEGLPSQGVVGFEIFDQSSFGTTDFERQVNFYRALGGELSRSIQGITAVEYARVQITAPKESIFVQEEQPAEASVLLKIIPGYSLNQSQVRAISNLVASSVQGLEDNNVTVVDTDGNLLTSNIDQENNSYSDQHTMRQFEIESEFANGLKQDLRTVLSRVLGPDNYTLQVKAKLNFDQREVESKEYSPVVGDEGIARSREEHSESHQGSNAATGGVPGTESNIPQYQNADEENANNSEYENSDIITNYEINEKIERHVYAPGEVEQISVAVVVNGEIAQENITKIEDVVHAAIGYNVNRGDTVTVTNLAFDRSLEEEIAEAEAAASSNRRQRTYIYSGLIILVFIIFFILFILMKKNAVPAGEEVVPGRAIDFMVDEEIAETAAADELTEEEKEREKMREEVAKAVSDKPEEVAQLLKSWLLDE